MGMFSWFTSDENERIVAGKKMKVWMVGQDGQEFEESCYDGYGRFGGKDFYEYMAELNGEEPDRDIGIDLAFDEERTDIIWPRLFSDPASLENHWNRFPAPVTDPNQGFPDEWGIG